jgi:hypothetical protein
MPAGRIKLTPEIAEELCERIALGESLRAICDDEHMPDKATVLRWLQSNSEFRDQYARAREDQADTFADAIVAIADTEPDPNVARVRIDARKWAAGKLRPKVYGDKVTSELTGPDGAALPPMQIIVAPARPSDEESLV